MTRSGAAVSLVASVREFFVLGHRRTRARRGSFAAGEPGWPEFVLGQAALSDARQLALSEEGVGSALLLYRSALLLLERALRARPATPLAAAPASAAGRPSLQLPPLARLLSELPAEQKTLVEGALDPDSGEAHLAKLSRAQQELAATSMYALGRALAGPLVAEAEPLRQVLFARRWRAAAAALLLLLGSGWLGVKLLSRPNLALHVRVEVSGSSPELSVAPEQLVDGDRRNLGFHTDALPDQTVTLDLGALRRLHAVHVYNRADCCQERAVPLRLEVSADGVEYQSVERRTHAFSVWKVALPSTELRFVRLAHEGSQHFHLSEVEVY